MSKLYDRIADQMIAYNERVYAQLTEYQEVSPTIARIIVSTVGIQDKTNKRQVAAAITAALKNQAFCIPGSFRELATASEKAYFIGYVSSTQTAIPFASVEKEQLARMKTIAKNIMMDEQDESLWDVKEVAGAKYLVRQAREDLSELLSLASTRSLDAPTIASLSDTSVVQGEYMAFVHPTEGDMRYGYVLASSGDKSLVLDRKTNQVAKVPTIAKVEAFTFNEADAHIHNALDRGGKLRAALASAAGGDFTDLVDYYRGVYGYDAAYFEKFEKIVEDYGF